MADVNTLSNYIHLSKYARYLDKEKRRETWEETVDRYCDFFEKRKLGWDDAMLNEFIKIRAAIKKHEVMPSMRALWTAGKALDIDNAAGFNCAGIGINHPRCFDEIFYLLMCGCGLGYSVENSYIQQLPEVAEKFYKTDTTIVVADSKIGWASSLHELISLLYSGKVPKWDVSRVRPSGSRLKTFGGRASGPKPLERLFERFVTTFQKAKSRKLQSIEVFDLICFIADAVIVGSVRRSACICLSDLMDDRMRAAKVGAFWIDNPQRQLCNISTAYTEKPDLNAFFKEFGSMHTGRTGERGIVNKKALKDKALGMGRNDKVEYCLNPCFHPNTQIETVNGRVAIKDILEPTFVYSMDDNGRLCLKKATASWITKTKAATICIEFNNGETITVTPNHKIFKLGSNKGKDAGKHGWVEARSLKPGDKLNGFYRVRQGAKYSGIKLATEKDYQMEHRFIYEEVYGKIHAYFDVHHIDNDSYNNSIENLESIQFSCANNHQQFSEAGNFNAGNTGLRVKEVHQGPIVDVYDIAVEGTHCLVADGIIAHNCGEAILPDTGGFCNLSEVVIRPADTLEDLKRKVRYATILGKLQSTLTDFRYLRPIWKKNSEEERLIGISLTGIMDHAVMSGVHNASDGYMDKFCGDGNKYLSQVLVELKQVAKDTDKEWSLYLNIPEAKQRTLIKPSGTVSQLVNSSSGIHPRMYPYYIRNVRQDVKDPLSDFMISVGIPYIEEGEKYVFKFPIKSPDGAITIENVSAIDQLELWSLYQQFWCDGNPSQTVHYKDDEFFRIADWIWTNWDDVVGLSFLPKSDMVYKNPPFECISREEYEQLLYNFPKDIDWGLLSNFEKEDCTTGASEVACQGGACEI